MGHRTGPFRRRREMSFSIGIIGLPNVGKSTLLNALSKAHAEASNYPFCTIDCNQGIVPVPDSRLERLTGILEPKEVIPATVRFIDIAGLVAGASRGEGLGNKFLHHVREANVLAHVLRCFRNLDVSHVHGDIDPVRDLEIVETELFLADIERVERWLEKERAAAKARKKDERKDLDFLERVRETLSKGRRIRVEDLHAHEVEIMGELQLLTSKPSILVLNAGEEDQAGEGEICRSVAEQCPGREVFIVSAKIEQEISDLPPEEQAEFMRELGLTLAARDRFIERCHEMLGLIRYYTTAHEKLQAWSLPAGTTAPQAAGRIHSDMEQGFIRAEVMSFDDLVSHGSRSDVQHHGLLRTEGHDYIVRDGDVITFLFNK
jgi:GTP-binding protein YchF